jgi:hypothetical protein
MWEEKQTCSWCFGKGVVYGGTVCSSCNGHGYTIIRHSDSSSGGSSSRSGGGGRDRIIDGHNVNGKFYGKGEKTYSNGAHYIGDFVNGIAHGYGKMTYKSGNVYEGNFDTSANGEDTGPHGKGKMTYKNGDVYEGDFVNFGENSQRHGKGKYTWANPNVCKEYEGGFFEGKHQGKGKYILTDGRIFEGEFDRNTKIANGKITYPNGKTETGTWDDVNDVFTKK